METQNPYLIHTSIWGLPSVPNPFKKKDGGSGLFSGLRKWSSNRKAEAAERENEIANNKRRQADAEAETETNKRATQNRKIKTEQEKDERKRVEEWRKGGHHLVPQWRNQGHHARQIHGQRRRT